YTIVFIVFQATPGGPWDSEKPVPTVVREHLNAKYGLDKPLWQQYVDYLAGVVTQFDLGPSYKYTSRTVNDIIGDFFPNSMVLGLMAMSMAVLVGIPLGVVAALKQNSWIDYLAMLLAVTGITLPTFIIGPLLVWVLILTLNVPLPTGGWGKP